MSEQSEDVQQKPTMVALTIAMEMMAIAKKIVMKVSRMMMMMIVKGMIGDVLLVGDENFERIFSSLLNLFW